MNWMGPRDGCRLQEKEQSFPSEEKRREDTELNFIEHEDEVLEEEQVKVVFRAAGCCEAEASMSKSFKKKGVHRNFTVLESKIGKPRYSLRKDRRVKDQDCRGAKM